MNSAAASAPLPEERLPFEQRIFAWSPLGTAATTAILFLLLASSFVLLAYMLHVPIVEKVPGHFRVESGAFQAMVLALLATVVLGLQRYTALKEIDDEPGFAAISTMPAAALAITRPAALSRMRWGALIGGIAGIGLAFVVIPNEALRQHPALYAWHFTVTVFLSVLFGRGVLMTAQDSRAFGDLIEHHLKIDLLHIDKLAVIGRHSARNALVWLTCAAVVCLFFVSEDMSSVTMLILLTCAGMGLWIFVRPMEHVHRRIRAAKAIELDRIRDEIAKARDGAVHDAAEATKLQGLLAYETRIQAVHEWPFDQSTVVRVGAYVLIPAIPWFGEAVVSDMVQRLAH